MRHIATSTKAIHIETAGCIINIRPGLHDAAGNTVTSIEVVADPGWDMPDLADAKSVNLRVMNNRV